MKCTHRAQGFTLVEILVVIAVVGILTAVVIGSTTAARATARDSARQSDLKEIQLGLALYFDVNRQYPSTLQPLLDQKYIPSLPADPLGTQYEYYSASPYGTYCLGAKLESSIPVDNANCSSVASGQAQTSNYTVKPPVT